MELFQGEILIIPPILQYILNKKQNYSDSQRVYYIVSFTECYGMGSFITFLPEYVYYQLSVKLSKQKLCKILATNIFKIDDSLVYNQPILSPMLLAV